MFSIDELANASFVLKTKEKFSEKYKKIANADAFSFYGNDIQINVSSYEEKVWNISIYKKEKSMEQYNFKYKTFEVPSKSGHLNNEYKSSDLFECLDIVYEKMRKMRK